MTEKAESKKSDSESAGSGTERDKPSLDDLLASYGKGSGDAKPTEDGGDQKPDPTDERIRRLEAELAQRDADETMKNDVIPRVRGDLDIDDEDVEAFVNYRASKDPRIVEVWDNRRSDPKAFKAMLDGLAEEAAKKYGGQDDGRREVNAVRNSRQSKPALGGFNDVDWASLNDNDFELKKREVYKAAEKGLLR